MQYVSVDGYDSSNFAVSSGVSQGSRLTPPLFLIYINDIIDALKRYRILIFADDLQIFLVTKFGDDCHTLQLKLRRFKIFYFIPYPSCNSIFGNVIFHFIAGKLFFSISPWNFGFSQSRPSQRFGYNNGSETPFHTYRIVDIFHDDVFNSKLLLKSHFLSM